jgi:hypothetical protein
LQIFPSESEYESKSEYGFQLRLMKNEMIDSDLHVEQEIIGDIDAQYE